MTIRLHVERIALEGIGLSGVERARLERALVTELTQLLSSPGAAEAIARRGGLASVAAPELMVQPNDTGAGIGRSLAHAVFGSIAVGESPATTRPNTSASSARGAAT